VISSSRTKSKTPTSCSRIVIFGYFCGCVECKYIKSEELYITPEGYELSQLKSFPLFLTAFFAIKPSQFNLSHWFVLWAFTLTGTCLTIPW
jgi:hypothetical protein